MANHDTDRAGKNLRILHAARTDLTPAEVHRLHNHLLSYVAGDVPEDVWAAGVSFCIGTAATR